MDESSTGTPRLALSRAVTLRTKRMESARHVDRVLGPVVMGVCLNVALAGLAPGLSQVVGVLRPEGHEAVGFAIRCRLDVRANEGGRLDSM
jgi:hypothetical protein